MKIIVNSLLDKTKALLINNDAVIISNFCTLSPFVREEQMAYDVENHGGMRYMEPKRAVKAHFNEFVYDLIKDNKKRFK